MCLCGVAHFDTFSGFQNIFEDNAAMSADEARRLIESMKVEALHHCIALYIFYCMLSHRIMDSIMRTSLE